MIAISVIMAVLAAVFSFAFLGTQKNTPVLPVWALLGSFAVAYFYVEMIFASESGWFWLPIFTAAFFAWVEGSLRAAGKTAPPRESLFWLAVCAVLCVSCTVQKAVNGSGSDEMWRSLLALHLLAAYWVVCRAGCLAGGQTGALAALDGFTALVFYPFGGFLDRARGVLAALRGGVHARLGGRIGAKNVLLTLAALLCALPLLGWAGSLLSSADADFSAFMAGLWNLRWPEINVDVWNFLIKLVVSLPVGAYLCGLVSRAAAAPSAPIAAATVQTRAEHLRVMPGAAGILVLAAFCGLYLLFFGVKAGVLAAALSGRLPAGYSASASAREGFFQLCWVMVINFGVLLGAAKLSRAPLRTRPAQRALAAVLLLESLFLAVTAAARLGLYFWLFGLTPLRLLAGWGILALFAAAVFALCSLWRARPIAKRWLMLAAAAFALQSALQLLCLNG